jgi:peroxiredoxin (alkyl hydroperoxide reductase subunit C)
MHARLGHLIPDIDVEAFVPGRSEPDLISLAAQRGRWLVLFFYPRDFTFICPTELQAFAELHDDFEAEGAVLLAASTDSFWSHQAWFGTHPSLQGVRYPVLADPAHLLSTAFGVLDPDGAAYRATFIADPDGVLRHVSISDQNVGRNPAETLRVLQALKTGELCPVDWRPGEPTLSR